MSGESPTEGTDKQRSAKRSEIAKALARCGMESVHLRSLMQADEVLTPKRQEIIEASGHGEYESVQQLARELDRHKGQVSRDLKTLSKHATSSNKSFATPAPRTSVLAGSLWSSRTARTARGPDSWWAPPARKLNGTTRRRRQRSELNRTSSTESTSNLRA